MKAKKFLSLALSVAMVLSGININVFATGTEETETTEVVEVTNESSDVILTPEDLIGAGENGGNFILGGDIDLNDLGAVAKIGDVRYETLQAAIDAATEAAGEYEIVIVSGRTVDENIIIHQTDGVDITIKGNGENTVFTGYVEIYGHCRYNGTETLTFDGIVFKTEEASHVFIEQTSQTGYDYSAAKCYPHNVTVQNCIFEATGAAENTAVGMKYRYGYNISVADTNSMGMHSLMQNYAGVGLTIENVNIEGKNGIALGTSQNVTVKNATIEATGYGLRADAQIETETVIENCEITAFIPVVVRKAEKAYLITVNGTNTMTASNEDGIWCAIGTSEYDTNGSLPTDATADVTVTLNDTKLSKSGVYGALNEGLLGSGTEEDPFLIQSLDDLIWFRDSVNTYASDGSNQYKGKYVKITTDIDLDGINWTPIGTNTVGDHMAFLGTFDGDGHTIKNLCINADGDHLGFFARTGSYYETEKAVVKNLNFVNIDVSSNTTTGHGGSYVGGVIANTGGNTYIENVHITGYVYVVGYGYIGGIAGHGYPKINNCSVKAEDGSYVDSHYWSVGGILGYGGEGGTKLTNCEVSGLDIWGAYGAAAAILGNARTGVVGENLTAKNVTISGNDYALGYIFGNDGDNLTNVTCENVKIPEGAEPSDAVAAIGSAIYFDLQSAIDAVEEDETITVLRDVTITTPAYGENALNYAKAVNCTIDLNGKTVSANTGNSVLRFNIANSGATSDVTVTVKNGKVVSGENTWCALMASGIDGAKAILNIENVKVENSKAGDFAVKAWGNSVINAKNVDITSSYGGGFYAVGGEIVLEDCTAVQTGLHTAPYLSMAFGVSNNGKMTIKSGDYSAAPTAIADGNNQGQSHGSWVGGVMNSGGTLIINGGTFANDNFGDNSLATAARGLICVDTGAILEINGGTFNALKGIIDYQNNLGDALKNPVTVIKGGTYSANPESDWVKVAEGFEVKANEDGTYDVQKNANLILTIEELKAFKDAVNAGNTYKGVTVKLGADIDLAGEEWTPIGNSTNKFQGTFDGQNHTISNLVITGNKSDVGLFGFTTDGEVKNLTVNNAKVSGRLNVGVVAGTPYTSKYTNIAVTGHVEINGMSYVGGVFGKNVYADVTGVTVDVDETSYVKATSTENGKAYRTYVGGVIGFMGEGGHTVSDVTSNINVTGDVCDIGGIVGIAHYGNNFKNITCTATVTNTNQDAVDAAETGGIAGVWHNGGAAVTFDEVYFDGKVVAAGVAENAVLGAAYSASGSGDKTVENEKVAKIGTTKYDTLSNAISAAQSGDTVVIIADGTYALPSFGKNITIEAAGGIGATITVNKTKVTEATFNNVTFKYATTSSYNGIQHSAKLTYNNCTFEGQVFLYATEETFNNCTFNTTDANNYNVWTYSAAKVDFNNCTFNSAGKSVHVYNEGATATDLTVEGCIFTASQAVEGKAAIEIDTTLMPDGTDIVIKNSTAEGFAAGSVSGNSLWNDKKNQTDLTVTVDDAQVWPVVARIGEVGYATLQEALAAVTSGATVDIVSDITITEDWDNRYTGAKITVPVTINGNGKTIKFTGAVADGGNYHSVFRFENDAIVKNLTIDMSEATTTNNRLRAISSKGDLTVDNCEFIGNTNYTNTRAIIFGEGSGSAIGKVDVKITNSTFTNWRRGVIDNENAQDANSVEITGNAFTNANVSVSAKESVKFTGNTMVNSWATITTYTAQPVLSVVAIGNTLAENDLATGNVNYVNAYATVDAQEGFLLPIAKIGTKGYFSLQSAVDAANAGDTVMLVSNIALTESVNVAADDVITLDLAGYTITGTDTTQKNFGLINVNKGNLTVKDSGGTGKITLTATTDSGWNRYSAVIANNQGILTVESGKIEHLGGTAMAYGIDNLTNGNIGDATAVINGGTINSTYRGIRQFANSATCVNSLTIEGGKISGDNKAVWLQSSNKNANKATLEITGGEVGDVYIYAPEDGDVSALTLSAKEANVANVINGLTSGYTVEKGNGVWTISKAVASLTDTEENVTYYSSLAAALAAAELTGGTVTLFADIETDEVLKISGTKKVTIEGQGYTVTGNAKKTFEVHSTSAKFNNINIVNTAPYGRCIDTRVDNVHVTVTESSLEATGVNSQPITVGGENTNPNKTAHLNVQNTTINAGNSGYGIIVFQEGAEINITNSQITGYAALYLKEESKGSTVTVRGKSVLTGNNYSSGVSNTFGTVVFETSDVVMTVAPYATIVANNYGDQAQSAFELSGRLNTITMEGKVVTNGSNAFVLGGFVYDANYPITVADDLVDALNAEGYNVESNIVTGIKNITLTADSVIVRGITAIGKTGTLVLASYDKDGRLTDVALSDVTCDTVINLADTGLKTDYSVKASLLSSMSTLTPLCDAVSIVIE